jgi:hypothetical protein
MSVSRGHAPTRGLKARRSKLRKQGVEAIAGLRDVRPAEGCGVDEPCGHCSGVTPFVPQARAKSHWSVCPLDRAGRQASDAARW